MRFVLLLLAGGLLCEARTYSLDATPQTICWGYYWAKANPALKIHSGDVVKIQTVSGNPARLAAAGAKPEDIQPALKAIYEKVPASEKGPGGHLLTGPVYIEEAQPGDVLEVRILKIDLDMPYAYNSFGPTSGVLQDNYPYQRTKIIQLDPSRNVANFGSGIVIPLHPSLWQYGHCASG
jgi:acetamidase/formamidase